MRVQQVLIAEDDLNLQKLLTKALKSTNFHVTGIMDGAEVLQYLKLGLPDLLILDWGLPNADGQQILQALQRWDKDQKVRIILMTGNHAVAKSDEARQVEHFLLKPVSIRELVTIVQQTLSV